MSAKEFIKSDYLVCIWCLFDRCVYIIYLTDLITLNLSKQPAVTEFSVLVISVTLV